MKEIPSLGSPRAVFSIMEVAKHAGNVALRSARAVRQNSNPRLFGVSDPSAMAAQGVGQ